MKTISGDLIKMAQSGEFDVIVHGCNCFNTMGSGIAAQIAREHPSAYFVDQMTTKGSRYKLGNFTTAPIMDYFVDGKFSNFTIVNGYTQFDYGTNKINVDYDAIKSVFEKIVDLYPDKRIGYPMIGAGLAGGDWDIISNIINGELCDCDHTFVKFDK